MKLHTRVQPSGSVAVCDEAGHLVQMFTGASQHWATVDQAKAFIDGAAYGERAAKLDRSATVDRAHKLLDELR